MPNRIRSFGLGLIAATIILVAIGLSRPSTLGHAAVDTLESTGQLKWYRGNLHTHSFWSDGDDFPEMIAVWYRDKGYDFLAFTDHNVLANRERWMDLDKTKGGRKAYDKLKTRFPDGWIDERTSDDKQEVRLKRFDEVFKRLNENEKFLLIQGEEVSDAFHGRPIHMNANNVVEAISPRGGRSTTETIQNNVNALVAQRERTKQPMMIHLNHPNFGWGITAEDLAPIRGESFFEVYNGHPTVHNQGDDIHPSNERIWDIVNTKRLTELDLPLLYGLATDDGHSYHTIPSRESEPGRGWVMVLSTALNPASLIQAMEAGRFYASSGVTLEKISVCPQSLEVTVHQDGNESYTIEFIGTRHGFDPSSEPIVDKNGRRQHITRKYSNEIGAVLKIVTGTTATYSFDGDELYVRARITSSRKHPNPSAVGEFEQAWTQPVRP